MLQQCELALLLLAIHVGSGRHERKRLVGIDFQIDAGVLRPEIAGPMSADAAAAVARALRRARRMTEDCRSSSPDHNAPTNRASEGIRRRCGGRCGTEGSRHDRCPWSTWSESATPHASCRPCEGTSRRRRRRFFPRFSNPVCIGYSVSLIPCWPGTNAFRFSLVNGLSSTSLCGVSESCLPGVFVQRRLGIERLDMAHAAEHEQPDHAFRLRLKVRLAVGQRPVVFHGARSLRQHRAEREPGQAHAGVGEKNAP